MAIPKEVRDKHFQAQTGGTVEEVATEAAKADPKRAAEAVRKNKESRQAFFDGLSDEEIAELMRQRAQKKTK